MVIKTVKSFAGSVWFLMGIQWTKLTFYIIITRYCNDWQIRRYSSKNPTTKARSIYIYLFLLYIDCRWYYIDEEKQIFENETTFFFSFFFRYNQYNYTASYSSEEPAIQYERGTGEPKKWGTTVSWNWLFFLLIIYLNLSPVCI